MNLMDLSPDEKDALLQQLLAQQEQPEEEDEFLDPLVNIIEILVQKVQAIEEKTDKLETVVMDEIVGGISSLYSKNKRAEGIDGLMSKYGPQFEPYKGAYVALNDGADDLWDKLYDHLEELRAEAGDSFNEDEAIGGVLEGLKSRVDAIKGPVEVKTEIVKEAEPEDELVTAIKKMKQVKK